MYSLTQNKFRNHRTISKFKKLREKYSRRVVFFLDFSQFSSKKPRKFWLDARLPRVCSFFFFSLEPLSLSFTSSSCSCWVQKGNCKAQGKRSSIEREYNTADRMERYGLEINRDIARIYVYEKAQYYFVTFFSQGIKWSIFQDTS